MASGFNHLLLILGLALIGLISLSFYSFKQIVNNIVSSSPLKAQQLVQPTPSPWKIYQNTKYNFKLSYPKIGERWIKDEYLKGECGQSIKEGQLKGSVPHWLVKEVIKVDNFFEIKVVKNQESINSYLKIFGADREYDLEEVKIFGADEAQRVIGLKKGAKYAVGFPPLVYVSHVIRKGENLFLIVDLEHPDNEGGCVAERFLDPVKYEYLKPIWEIWNPAVSFQFISNI